MNCANHPEAPAVAYCRECGKALCEMCRREANGIIYCDVHAPGVSAPAGATWSAAPPPPPPPPPQASTYSAPPPQPEANPYTAPPPPPHPNFDTGASPGLAFVLGFIPGVGAIYNGQYVKGLVHVVVLGILISLASSDDLSGGFEPLFGMLIALWVFYMAFEAYHTAKRRQLGEPVDEFSSIVPRSGRPSQFPLAPTVLIAVGLVFLLHNLNIIRISELLRYWPVALIGLGAYMLYERLAGNSGDGRRTLTGGPRRGLPQDPEVTGERR
jgi:TM2 domain-containing membrane protein YozV